MTDKKVTTNKTVLFCKETILPILLVFLLFWLYVKCFCLLSSQFSSIDLVCSHNWKYGLFLIISYSIVKLSSPLLDFDTVFKRYGLTLVLYSIFFAMIAFPYWVASFLQYFTVNTFIHISLLILAVELTFKKYSRNKSS